MDTLRALSAANTPWTTAKAGAKYSSVVFFAVHSVDARANYSAVVFFAVRSVDVSADILRDLSAATYVTKVASRSVVLALRQSPFRFLRHTPCRCRGINFHPQDAKTKQRKTSTRLR